MAKKKVDPLALEIQSRIDFAAKLPIPPVQYFVKLASDTVEITPVDAAALAAMQSAKLDQKMLQRLTEIENNTRGIKKKEGQ